MKCHYHPDLDSVKICSICSRSLCQSCAHSIKGRILCTNCVVAGAEFASIATSPRLANYSPARAAVFGIIPGIGAVYNQQYVKAVQHFAVFAALLLIADRGPEIFGFAAFAFWIFTIIDAYRSAQSILRQAAIYPGAIQEQKTEVNVPIWGGVLVALGVIFFLDNLRLLRLDRLLDYAWPLLFVIVGFYLILDFYRKDHSQPAAVAAPNPSRAAAAAPPPAPSSENSISLAEEEPAINRPVDYPSAEEAPGKDKDQE